MGVPLDRLRKEVAHQRLLARLAHVAPEGYWALKGGQVLLARLGGKARVTKDADATWREPIGAFEDTLEEAVDLDLGDYFAFEVGEPGSLEAETEEGGLRYSVLVLVDGREFERLQLDVNFVHGDPRPVERIRLRDLLGFAGIEPPEVPVISVAQQLAEKLHAYSRRYPRESSRTRDLFDMLAIAAHLAVPAAGDVVATCRETFALRGADWPPDLPSPPADWALTWSTYVEDYEIPWVDLESAYRALRAFWEPVLAWTIEDESHWNAGVWGWQT